MAADRRSAVDEIKLRIKALDREESNWMRAAGQQEAQLGYMRDQIVQIGNKRRQYEFALKQLGCEEDPTKENRQIVVRDDNPSVPVKIPVKHDGVTTAGK